MASVSSIRSSNRSNVPLVDRTRWASIMFSGASVHSCHDATSGSSSNCVSAESADVAPTLGEETPRASHALFGPLQQ